MIPSLDFLSSSLQSSGDVVAATTSTLTSLLERARLAYNTSQRNYLEANVVLSQAAALASQSLIDSENVQSGLSSAMTAQVATLLYLVIISGTKARIAGCS